MRDRIAADTEALRQLLADIENTDVAASKIPMMGQMIMGFILPFILTFVAIPFESFVSSSRTLLGLVCAWALRALAFVFRLVGNIGFYMSRLIVNVFDIVVSPILWAENLLRQRKGQQNIGGTHKNKKGDETNSKEPNVASLKEKSSGKKEATA
jgi:hypothetical protein